MHKSVLRNIQVVASFALLASVPVVNASSPSVSEENGRLTVSFADLDLSSDAGVAALYQRLQRASDRACATGSILEKGSARAVRDAEVCVGEVLSKMVAEIDNAKLTAIHSS